MKTAKKRRLFGGIFAHFLRGFQGKKLPKNAYAFYEKRIEVYIFWVAHYKGRCYTWYKRGITRNEQY